MLHLPEVRKHSGQQFSSSISLSEIEVSLRVDLGWLASFISYDCQLEQCCELYIVAIFSHYKSALLYTRPPASHSLRLR